MATAAPPRKPRENRTRYVVLGMLTAGPMSGYGLRQRIAGSVGHFWQESYGQLYPTLRRLAAEGLVVARAARGGPGRDAATYRLTARGRAALAAWVALPPAIEPERNEVLLKVFFARVVPPEVTARNLEGIAAQLRAQLVELEAVAARFDAAPPPDPGDLYCRLTLDFGLDFTRTALDWLERAGAVFDSHAHRARAAARRGTDRRSTRSR